MVDSILLIKCGWNWLTAAWVEVSFSTAAFSRWAYSSMPNMLWVLCQARYSPMREAKKQYMMLISRWGSGT